MLLISGSLIIMEGSSINFLSPYFGILFALSTEIKFSVLRCNFNIEGIISVFYGMYITNISLTQIDKTSGNLIKLVFKIDQCFCI